MKFYISPLLSIMIATSITSNLGHAKGFSDVHEKHASMSLTPAQDTIKKPKPAPPEPIVIGDFGPKQIQHKQGVPPSHTEAGRRDIVTKDTETVFTRVDIRADPRGGMVKFRQWFTATCKYPEEAKTAKINGVAKLSFVVEKDGSLTNFEVIESLGHGIDGAIIETLKKSPKWVPAVHNGHTVRSLHTIPLKVDLTEE